MSDPGPSPIPSALSSLSTGQSTDYSANVNLNQQAQIELATDTFLATIGWPSSLNANTLEYDLWKSGKYADPNDAYSYLYGLLPQDLQANNPWAQYGLSKDDYNNKAGKINAMYQDYVGTDAPADVLHQALTENWSSDQLTNFLSKSPEVQKNDPYVTEGLSYKQVSQEYVSLYGTEPADKATLRSWWLFGKQAKQTGGGALAPVQPAAQQKAPTDTAVR